MKRTAMLVLAGTLIAWNAAAQTQSGAQAGASAQNQTSAQAGQNSASLASGTTMNAARISGRSP